MRQLKVAEGDCEDCIIDNFRPPVDLGDRSVRVAQF